MPSASAKLEKQASVETFDPVKQVLTIVEKKVRNLEKRKGKLDSYRQDSQNGKELNEDQKKAVEKYEQVLEVLEFAKELQKQFQSVMQECCKAQKKALKREQVERQQQELQRIKEIIVYQDLLTSMGGEDVRQDFLEGKNGAVKLSEEELNSLDELYKAICPERDPESLSSEFDQLMSAASEHIQALLDSKSKEVFGTTYKALRETLLKIASCSYFNKNDTENQNETESSASLLEEKDEVKSSEQEYAHEHEISSPVETDDHLLSQPSVLASTTQIERPFYPIESSSLYSEQNHPIQEVLSVQGNLNFLQESQIEVEASHTEPQAAVAHGAPYSNVQFSAPSQSITAANIASQHHPRRPSGETPLPSHPSTASIVLANSGSLQQQVGPSIPPQVPLNPTSQPIDFDPARPIPTQTYTNQSFSTAIHPMMAQNYVPVVTLPHTIPAQHVLSSNLVVQPLPPRSTVTSSPLAANPNALSIAAAHTPVSGLSAASALSQQANIYSLCLKMNQMNSENNQSACVTSTPYECNELQEGHISKNANASFGNGRDNGSGSRESRSRSSSNAYVRGSSEIGYGNDTAYQSTNNTQAYLNRDSFTDNSSYSSNLKRGLNARGGVRGGNAPRGTNSARGNRAGYRN